MTTDETMAATGGRTGSGRDRAWRRARRGRRAALAAAALGLAAGLLAGGPLPARAQAAAVDQAGFVRALLDGFARPAATALRDRLADLGPAVAEVCAPDVPEAARPAARQAFAEAFAGAVEAHGRLSVLRAGPLADDTRAERLAFVPDSRGVVRRQVSRLVAAADPTALDPDSLRAKSVAVQGLTALEWIAFDAQGAVVLGLPAADAEPAAAASAAYACGYAAALVARLAATAEEITGALDAPSGQTALLLAPGADNALARSDAEAAAFVFNALMTALELARDQIVAPLLADGPVAARAARLPFARSQAGFRHLAAAIGGIADAVTAAGFAPAGEGTAWIDNTLAFEAGNARRALAALDADPAAALADPDDLARLVYVRAILDGLRTTLAGQLAGGLGFQGGFNALDGD